MKKNFDLYYMALALLFVIADALTKSSVLEGMAFLIVVMGFVMTAIPKGIQLKDERYQNVRAHAGYLSFMIMIIVIAVVMMSYRYLGLETRADIALRYLMMAMYFVYTITYALVKRAM